MSYSNVINAINTLKDANVVSDYANKGNNLDVILQQQGVNPYSSEAYFPKNIRDMYAQYSEVQDPRSVYKDQLSGISKFDKNLMKFGSGMTGYNLGSKVSPFIRSGAQSIYSGLGMEAPGALGSVNFGPAAAVYGAFGTDNNPYTLTRQEKLGTIGSTMMAAHQLSKLIPATSKLAPLAGGTALKIGAGGINPLVMIGALLLGNIFNKKRQKNVDAANQKVVEDIERQQDEGYRERSQEMQDIRDDINARAMADMYTERSSRYDNQYGGNLTDRFQGYGKEGMKFTPKELNKIAKAGRNGDTMLAHVNPPEAALLKALGGSGTKNPYTGLPEYGYGSVLSSIFDPVSNILSGVGNVLQPIADPFFDAAGSVVDPIQDTVSPIIKGAGDLVSEGVNTGVKVATNLAKNVPAAAGKTFQTVGETFVEPIAKPVMDTVSDALDKPADLVTGALDSVLKPTMDFAQNTLDMGFDAIDDVGHGAMELARPGFELVGDYIQGLMDLLSPGQMDMYSLDQGRTDILKRPEQVRDMGQPVQSGVQLTPMAKLSQLQQERKNMQPEGDWISSKENPFVTPNVEEELDYAKKGMKFKYGGKTKEIVAEFTGNELIVNDQNKVEEGLRSGNYAMAAAPIRKAMKGGYITPGKETHKSNPMPVDNEGNIYTKGGKLNFKVNKGAGVYDHATDQFKTTMTDKEIAKVASKNIKKWKSNGMA